jgi:hypothetical protein
MTAAKGVSIRTLVMIFALYLIHYIVLAMPVIIKALVYLHGKVSGGWDMVKVSS